MHVIFDCELIGTVKPVFLTCCKIIETGETFSFWHHKRGHTAKLEKLLQRDDLTWVGFNSENFDRPLIAAAIMGHDEGDLKLIAQRIIEDQMRSWQTYRQFKIDFIEYDHIDLIETAPGVMISLKTYAGRMGYPTMVDLPFHHDKDLTPAQCKVLERYCLNDLGVTEALFQRLQTEIELRIQLGEEYGIDLRSKSDAQCAEAILKKQVGITNGEKFVPRAVQYQAPDFIRTDSPLINGLIEAVESTEFKINRGNGSPELPEFLQEPIQLNEGIYKFGLGGLHSQHDTKLYLEATETQLLSDFDVASYYPNIMMKAGLIPNLGGNKGEIFLNEYQHIYDRRMVAKHANNKQVSNSLKILLNGTFGKLGSLYCSFYSPDLMLAVTLTGQLNLLCLIHELEQIKSVKVKSANTDGILVAYPPKQRDKILKVIAKNAKRTGFEYEETPYAKIAMKDVNNYLAITTKGKVKAKGLYASNNPKVNPLYLMKNPTMQVCADACAVYLADGTSPESYIKACSRMEDFVAIRNVKGGGGVQHKKIELIDDWFEIEPSRWFYDDMTTKPVKRKSRPPPREVGVGGTPFGRVARWYMTTQSLPPITYVGSGNKVPKTEGAKLCLTLPANLPKDLDIDWYVREAYDMLADMGLQL